MTYTCKRSCITQDFIIKPLYVWTRIHSRRKPVYKKATKYIDEYFLKRLIKCTSCNYITADPEDTVRQILTTNNTNGFAKLRCPCCHAIYSVSRRTGNNGRGKEIS